MLAFTRERRTTSEKVIESGRLEGLSAAMDAAGIGYWIFSVATNALQASRGVEKIFGSSFSDTATLDELFRFFDDEDHAVGTAVAELRAAAWRDALAGKTLFDEEHLVHRADERPLWVRSIVSAEFGSDGKLSRIFGLCIDVDDRRRRELASVEAGERAAEESRFKTDFLATMSHEIRTPLNGVLGIAQLLERTRLDEQQSEFVESIRASGQAMLSLLNDALDLSKIEKGLVELVIAPVDLGALARETLESARGQAVEKGLTLEARIDPALDCCRLADASRVRQIIANLVFNALKFTERGSVTLELSASPDGDGVRVSVADTGPGVPEDEQAKIFERFRQSSGEVALGGGRGTGLGLSICTELVRLMRGELGLRSKTGEGATFWADMPLPRAEAPPVQDAARSKTPEPRAFEDDGSVRILVAEDDLTNQKVFSGALAPTGYDVVIVNNGLEAIEKIEAERFDLVLMDLNMPQMSGDEAIIKIRASEEHWRDVPIVVVSAVTHRDARRQFSEIGANDYLPKPIDIEALLKKMRNLLGARKT